MMTNGNRVLLDICLGQRERYEDWLEMGRGLARRGLRSPDLAVGDGAPGLITAIGELWPEARRQRCTVYKLRNILAKLAQRPELQQRIRDAYWAALDQAVSPEDGESRLRALIADLDQDYPSAAACLAEDLPALCAHMNWPLHLRKRLRSTNLLERSLKEVKRRTKVIGRFPGEASCLSLCWAVMDLVIADGRGLGLTDLDRQLLPSLRANQPDLPAYQLTA
jgi:putative transposase